jgi:predicted ribosomally synthesized peptide with SipW-like signal peptide
MSKKIDKRIDGIFSKSIKTLACDRLGQVAERKDDFRFVYSYLKILGVSILLLFIISSLGSVGSTFSYFNDSESSLSNKLQAGIINFGLSSTNDIAGKVLARSLSVSTTSPEEDSQDEVNIGTESFEIILDKNQTNLPMEYLVSGKIDEGSEVACGDINISSWFEGQNTEGTLKDFSFATTTLGRWLFLLSIPEGNTSISPDALCKGKIIFTARLANVTDDLKNTFRDVKEYSFTIQNWPNIIIQNTEELKEEEDSTEEEESQIDQNNTPDPEQTEQNQPEQTDQQ